MNKLFDSMMGGKPILYAVEVPNNYIREFKCGVSVEAENISALVEGLQKIRSLTKEERKEMGENARRAVLDNFTYKQLAEKFAPVFD